MMRARPRIKFLMFDRLLKLHFVTSWVRLTLLVALAAGAIAVSIARITPADELPPTVSQSASYGNYLPILSDFDGDRRFDEAELHLAGTHHCIRVRFANFRETHLDFGTRSHAGGVLLVRDVNSDNKPDLIWVYRSRLEPTLVWLNDGAGHFARSGNEDADISSDSLFGDTGYTVTGTFGDERNCLASARPPSDFLPVTHFDHDSSETVMMTDGDSCHHAGIDLSCLRERGPPEHA